MTGNISRWLIKKFTLRIEPGKTSIKQVYKTNLPSLPVLTWALAETGDDETFTITIEYSYDGETYVNLVAAASGQVSTATATADLSSLENKPSAVPYIKIIVAATANNPLNQGESAVTSLTFVNWITDQGEDIVEHGPAEIA